MKKNIFAFVLILSLLLVLPLSASAEQFSGGSGWTVEFNTDEKLVSNFSSSSIAMKRSPPLPASVPRRTRPRTASASSS